LDATLIHHDPQGFPLSMPIRKKVGQATTRACSKFHILHTDGTNASREYFCQPESKARLEKSAQALRQSASNSTNRIRVPTTPRQRP
jgi:hypothetical protein